ncbi:MAG: acetyl-CoA carboxylase carboxyltransferase subunit alpha [Nevskiaceae bacterium]|nr:MAG: acetyl-CoA carboxylase carboxyltransferase subunit alpha [Nevskiaceae bacterium]TBR71777.1 MAG: acetyl-CoA carboxylase carboxyltransferase subunit alpha [Nevskiaceae bacterium]
MTAPSYLDFERPIADLEKKIEELRYVTGGSDINLGEEIHQLEAKNRQLTEQIFANLEPWQIAQVARHPNRPYALDYITAMFTEWDELHGDRHFADDPALVCGVARLDGRAVAVIGHQKGRDTKERVYRNFGSARPEGYRKALRVMKLAEKFHLPVITLIDTAGAYAGISAEERNQSEAIARNLYELSRLRTPVIAAVVGEGGSGGALAVGVADRVLMLQYAIYSVISPEGCASILFKKADRAPEAAAAMRITAPDLLEFGLVDEVLPEPLGGAHRDPAAMAVVLKARLVTLLAELTATEPTQLLAKRYDRLMAYGAFTEKPGPASGRGAKGHGGVAASAG